MMRRLNSTTIAAVNGGWTDPANRSPSERMRPKLARKALHGPLGDYVRLYAPFTEASEPNILFHLLAMFGNLIGPNPHRIVGGVRHHTNLTVCHVGTSGRARKGTGSHVARRLAALVDPEWSRKRVQGGVTSGEGIVWYVRDRVEELDDDGQSVVKDVGVTDKRLFLLETELSQLLRRMNGDKSTISPVIRKAWDCDAQSVLRTGGHAYSAQFSLISIVGHIVRKELEKFLLGLEAESGFGNRVLFVYSERAQLLVTEDEPPPDRIEQIAARLRRTVDLARTRRRMNWDDEAARAWRELYPHLERERIGRVDDFATRAAAQIMRISLIFALLDGDDAIRLVHLEAASAAWDFCEQTLVAIFGSGTGNPLADKFLEHLHDAGSRGLARKELWEVAGRNPDVQHLNEALDLLERYGLARKTVEGGGPKRGRPLERWFAGNYEFDETDE